MPAAAAPTIVLLLGAADDAARTLASLSVAELPDAAWVVAWAGPDGASPEGYEPVLPVDLVDAPSQVAAINTAFDRAPGDIVVLGPGTEIGRHFFADLAAACADEPDAATVSTLSNSGGILSVPRRNLAWPLTAAGMTAERAAELVRDRSQRIRPRVPVASRQAVLLRRAALELCGPLDERLDWPQALADLCWRLTAAGAEHVVADEIYAGSRTGKDAPPFGWEGAAAERHPGLDEAMRAVAEDRGSALSRALLSAAVVLEPLSVTIDARCLVGGVSGTGVHVTELLSALAAREDLAVRAILPERPGRDYGRVLDGLTVVERVGAAQIEDRSAARSHVAHRPWQVETLADMALLDSAGERSVITQQDLIGYRTPGVFADADAWQAYRRMTAGALGLAAATAFFSQTVAAEAISSGLVEPDRAHVAPLGMQSALFAAEAQATTPVGFDPPERFLLVIGNRFRHKNTVFALDVLAALRERGWDGSLVLAGADVLHGSATGAEKAWLLRNAGLAPYVHDLGAVGQGEKRWLYDHAAAVLYPSVAEGYGLVPFEAAAAGVPCFAAPVSALRETVPTEAALFVPWDAPASAEAILGVLTDPAATGRVVAALLAVAAERTWVRTAGLLADVYLAAVRAPAPTAMRLTADMARAEHDYWQVRDGIPEASWRLVDPEAPLLDEELAESLGLVLEHGSRRGLAAVLRRLMRGR